MRRTPTRTTRTIATIIAGIAVVAATAVAPLPAAAHPAPQKVPGWHVILENTGGFIGIHETINISRRAAVENPLVAELFAVVEQPRFRALDPVYLPENTCCDRIFATLTVFYYDGTIKTIKTMYGEEAPDILWQAITLARTIGNAPA